MEFVEVRTQKQLEKALKRREPVIPLIEGDGYFQITSELWAPYKAKAGDSATVRAGDSATVRAWGSATVEAWGSATVEAGDSATVRAGDSATVRAGDSATVRAGDSATVEAWGSATVRAGDSATVEAWGSATVRAVAAVQVRALGTAQITAGDHVAVTRQSPGAKISGGIVIEIPPIKTAAEWCDYHGVEVKRGIATLFKALDEDFQSGHGFSYKPGTKPEAPDWDGGKKECGGGLHFSPTPAQALAFNGSAKKFVACPVRVKDIAVHEDAAMPEKVKAPGCARPVYEVGIHGEPVDVEEAKAA
jgi:uncharacterized cupin superfamily protein